MSKHSARTIRRAPILVVVIGALVAGGLADRSAGHVVAAPAGSAQTVQAGPVAAPAAAMSSSWFCAGATDANPPASPVTVPGQVVLANNNPRPAKATVTVVASQGQPSRSTVTVAPYTSALVAESVPGGSPWVGAIVDVDAGAVAVDQQIDGPLGRVSTPCATTGSSHWYFANGQTRVNADEALVLLNPYSTDSIVDLSFSTDQGIETPGDFVGLPVPARGLVAVDLGTHLRRRASIAATVTARTGSVVAWETQWVNAVPAGSPIVGSPEANAALADPALPVPGVAVGLGAPSAGPTWAWPSGLAGDGVDEQYVIYNPGPRPAEVKLSVGLQEGSAEPFQIPVGPYQVVPIISEQQARIPAGVVHTAILQSLNGVPVVAARTFDAQNTTVPNTPPRTGVGFTLGARMTAEQWLVAAPGADRSHEGEVVIYNPTAQAVKATVGPMQGAPFGAVAIPAGGRDQVVVPTGSGPVLVYSSGPTYAEYDLYGVGGTAGVSLSMAVPLT